MKRRALGALALALLAAAAFLAQASCVSVLGVEEDSVDNVITEMCKCPALGKVTGCEKTFGDRLDDGSPGTRADWLARYRDERCDECGNVLKCLSTKPTCTLGKCSYDEECCPAGGASKGVCAGGACKH